jgi:CBS domain-containing membrane protein
MLVRDVMTRDPLTARTDTSVYDAMQTLESEQIRHLPVVEDGELKGIVSDRDLSRFSHAGLLEEPDAARRRLRAPIGNVMTSDPVHVAPDDDIDEAIDLMLENRIGALPVCEEVDGRLVGIVSYVDLLRAMRGKIQ